MARSLQVFLALILLTGLFFMAHRQMRPDQIRKQRAAQRETPGPFPTDWFMQQRTWPDERIVQDDYLAAAATAERLSQQTLDEQPPWIPAGPNNIGGRVADIVGHPTDANTFYIAAASGGIFKTTDGGQTWQAVFDNAPGLSMGAMAMDGQHPDTVYVGTGEACSAGYSYFGSGVYRTTDGGTSWSHLGLTETQYISRIVVERSNPQSVWVAAMGELYVTNQERGIYHSPNGGQSWERVLFVNDSTGASDVAVHPTNPQIVFAAMWQRIRNPEARIAGGRWSGVYRSTDGGQSWDRITDGLPAAASNIGRIGIAISESSPNIMYAIYADDPGYFYGVYRSTDTGESWGRVNDAWLEGMYSNFGWYFGNIRVRPDNPNMVYVLGVDLYRSTNGGAAWDDIGLNVHVDHHAMWFNPQQPYQILLGNDGGVYRSTNNGNTWTFLDDLPVNQFYAATVDPQHPERRYGGTQDNGTLRTMTGAVGDWDHIHGGDGFYVMVDPDNSNVIYAEYQWGWLDRSDDGGWSWEDITWGIDPNERTNWSTPVAMSSINPAMIYYGAERVYRSVNRGDSWTVISPDLTDGGGSGNLDFGTITTIGVSEVNSQVIYAGTDDANVWVTRNGGSSWTNISTGLPNRWITRVVPDPVEENVVYVCVSGFRNAERDAHLFRSGNFGATWVNIGDGLPEGPLNDVIPDPEVSGRLYVASDFGTYVTPNWGENWIPLGEDLPRVPVIDLVFHNPSRQLVAATYGRSMFTLNLNQLILNRPPQIISTFPADFDTLLVDQTIVFSAAATDPDDDSLRYVWTRNGETLGTDTAVTIVFATAEVTEHIVVAVSDSELIAEHEWTFFVTNPNAVDDIPGLAGSHELVRVYPNPFNAFATIEYNIPTAGPVRMRVFDLTGRLIDTLLDGFQPAGQGRRQWSAPQLPSGTYFLSYTTQGQSRITKIFILR